MAEINQFFLEPITCYAQSGSADKLALSPNNNLVHIYRQQDSSWIEESVLSQHDLRVTSIDWAPKTNRIVTCSADRNAYVWVQSTDNDTKEIVWKPTLVLLRINRAATSVKWSPKEDKFAVGTAAKLVCVCYFESANDWWVSRHIKKPIKSTVTCIDWHPNNILLSCGSTDYKCRVFSTFIKEVDQKSDLTNLKSSTWFKNANSNTSDFNDNAANNDNTTTATTTLSTTGALINEFSNSGAWVHDVAFSPNGSKLAWVSHDSSISVVDSNQSMLVVTLKTRYLPFLSCVWVSENSIVAAGHDCCPMLFNHQHPNQNGKTEQQQIQPVLKFIGRLDRSQKRTEDGQSAMRKFRDLDAKADHSQTNSVSSGDSCLSTIHQNTIGQIGLYSKSKSVATVGLDGKFVVWSLDPSVL
uniref:Actin-related protein 2/3 complex subunit n=1 Tax=Aceria tosichella TaxID=561515 RepID=A0A6G1S927_9ACAR